ncbi:MAG: CHC2 zinc finger domain-containing protein [Clostridium sp.]|uniref:CHC2 zinc finger domain-containing protein n=1 Tax=Clostridium sp. TaxID=1506 RepID=UPI002906B4C0|nr:CHC2 zinc finger domain-containing protein [Clostridium sp.]MDU7338589.1 CHC2 zinc finger domain-containing protein [Clostridium sp.]
MYGDIFSQIKETVPMQAVAEQYGFEIKHGVMLCPFHSDSHPSLKVYPGSRGWHCFVCDAGGSVIDFVAKLFHLNVRQAAIRLDNDFRLGLSTEKPDRREVDRWVREQREKQAALDAYRAEYDAKCREAYLIRSMQKPTPNSPLWGEYAALLGRLDYLDNYYFIQNHWR